MNEVNELSPEYRNRWQPIEAHVFSVQEAKADHFRTKRIEITYSYRINGETHLGTFIDYGSIPPSDLHRGATITVVYNPANPSQSRVERPNSFGWKQIVWPVAGISLFILKVFGHGGIHLLLQWLHHP